MRNTCYMWGIMGLMGINAKIKQLIKYKHILQTIVSNIFK